MKKIFRKEVILGISVLTALAILIFGIDFLKGVNVFKPTNYYVTTFENVEGLTVSAPVTVGGFKIGQVSEIEYDYAHPGHINVEMSLDAEFKVPRGTRAVLTTDLLGTASIVLELSQSTQYVACGGHIEGVQAGGMMDAVGQMLPKVESTLPKVDSALVKVDTLLTDLDNVVTDPAVAQTLQNISSLTGTLDATATQLNKLVATLPAMAGDIQTITGNLAQTSQDLKTLMANANQLPLDSVMTSVQSSMDNINALTRQLNDPNSTVGQLLNDPRLYNNLNNTVSSLDSLFVDIKKNPKRYISIKLL